MTDAKNGWSEWSNHVLIELKRLNDEIQSSRAISSKDAQLVHQMIGNLKVEVGRLKIKAGMWGAVAGVIPVIILLLIKSQGG